MMGNRTMEDQDIDESDFQQEAGRVYGCEKNLAQHSGYLPRQRVFGSSPSFLVHVHEDNSDLPLLEPECLFRKQAQHRHVMSDGSG